MIEIKINSNNNESRHIDAMVAGILSDHRWPIFGGCTCTNYGKDECRKVMQMFKDKGYFAYYCERFDGKWIEIQIYANEYQPSNSGLNKLYRY